MGLLTAMVLAVSGAMVAPIAANAAPHHQIAVDVTEVANEKIVVNVTGSGFSDVQLLPGQTVPHVYLALIPKGTDLSTVGQGGSFPNISADVAPDGSLTYAAPLEAAAADLVDGGDYEVISWPSRSNPSDANLYTRADAVIDWAALFPAAPAVPTLSGVVTEFANDRVDIAVTGSGFDDVQALPGQSEPHVYVKLSEVGADLSTVAQDDPSLSTSVVDGAISGVLSVPAAGLDKSKSYELISWPSRSFPTESNVYARSAVTIDWAALFPAAPAVPTLSGVVTEFANDRVDIAVTGSGFDDVQALPGQSEPHVYVKLSEVGADLSTVAQDDPSLSTSVVDGAISGVLSVPAAGLDKSKSYELISWPSRSFPTESNVYARSAVTIDWAALFPAAPAVPTLSGVVTEFANDRVDIAVTGSGFDDVQALPGQSEPHVYVKLSEVGADLSTVAQDDPSLSTSVVDGAISGVLSVPAAGLDKSKSYELISWPSRSFPTESNVYARSAVTIDWAALFPAPVYEPVLTVTPNADLNPAGASVTVTGSGYNPNQPIYVTTCADVPLENVSFDFINAGCTAGALQISAHGKPSRPGALEFAADGSFTATMTVSPRANADATSLYTIANHTARNDRGQDAKATLDFAPAHETTIDVTAAPSDASFGDEVTLTATVTPLGAAGTVTFFDGDTQIGAPVSAVLGSASVKTSDLTAGAHNITARFTPANANVYEASESEVEALTIAQLATSTTLVASTEDATFGDTVTLTATVAPAVAGTVEFFDAAGSVGTAVVNAGIATLELDALDAGEYTFTAEFTPSDAANHGTSESDSVDVSVAKASSKTGLVSSTIAPKYGDEVVLTATVAPAAAGEVEFFNGAESVETVTVAAGKATTTVDGLDAGTYGFTAVFTPADENNVSGSKSYELLVTVEKATTTTTLTAPATVELGKATTLSASVSPAVPGSVAFFDGDTQIGDAVDYVSGTVPVETAELEADAYAFRAVFTPADEVNYEGSADTASISTVDHADAVVTINGAATAKITAGDTVVFAAGVFAEGTEVTAVVHSDPIVLGTKTVDANGVASFSWTVPAAFVGDHTVVFTTADGVEHSAAFSVLAANTGGGETPGTGNEGTNAGNGSNGGTTTAGTGAKGLAQTGSDGVAGLTAAAMLVLLAGAGLMLARRRAGAHS
ncbi:Ig-like domain-containing protein [Leucobacter rhizosphaerae]|uniref:Ig-like domain-containing protein n=1 Tax=Leucobacter rhizosphaerae TaxID=2932245 RepID=A0ABY4FUH5_9MICO|nr:Ig-like domain-containing protein [Leucobacter rhizosphaerae]UOQ59958.1 Ig-like domain-containing protein [Leucobacter rhizosphaerae]